MKEAYVAFDSALIGEQIGVGATADVFAYGEDKIIKIFHAGANAEYVEHEFLISKAVEETGLPVPRNYGISKVENLDNQRKDRLAIIQERVVGISVMKQVMIDEASGNLMKLVEQVVALQVRINSTAATGLGLREQKPVLRYGISVAPLLTDEEKEKLYTLLEALPAGNRICHCDYHFDNIFMTEKGLVCFDWCDAVCGNPTADLARSLLIFKCDATPDSIPPEVEEQIKRMRDTSIPLYISLYERLGGHYDHLNAWMAVVAAARLSWEVEANRHAMLRVVREYLTNA